MGGGVSYLLVVSDAIETGGTHKLPPIGPAQGPGGAQTLESGQILSFIVACFQPRVKVVQYCRNCCGANANFMRGASL